MEKQWFEAWFDSPYYHLLYKKRDESEAQEFIDKLLVYLDPSPRATMLDLACGKGRFSRYLADKGYLVTGLDLSVNNIEFARQFEAVNLSFFTQDMRKVFRVNYFDFIFSFFTSFGYFESVKDDLKSLQSVSKGLKDGGVYVLDFFNSEFVISNLIEKELKTVAGVDFQIDKWIKGPHVFKSITIDDNGNIHKFQERVRLFRLDELQHLVEKSGMKIIKVFGDYTLSDFDPENSQRMILVIKK
ncbi:MAG: class I SAM-dependent methyltransferase [Bacteroidetes bacterium]|nr:MAG: class I SAM-dependent methyltransferase [Bacteroidota bacterium]